MIAALPAKRQQLGEGVEASVVRWRRASGELEAEARCHGMESWRRPR